MPPILMSNILDAVPGIGFAEWGGDFFAFAAMVLAVTQFAKRRARNKFGHVPHWAIHTFNFTFSCGVAAIVYYSGNLTDTGFSVLPHPFSWLAFGLLGGVGATIGFEGLTAIVDVLRGGKSLSEVDMSLEQYLPVNDEAKTLIRRMATDLGEGAVAQLTGQDVNWRTEGMEMAWKYGPEVVGLLTKAFQAGRLDSEEMRRFNELTIASRTERYMNQPVMHGEVTDED